MEHSLCSEASPLSIPISTNYPRAAESQMASARVSLPFSALLCISPDSCNLQSQRPNNRGRGRHSSPLLGLSPHSPREPSCLLRLPAMTRVPTGRQESHVWVYQTKKICLFHPLSVAHYKSPDERKSEKDAAATVILIVYIRLNATRFAKAVAATVSL